MDFNFLSFIKTVNVVRIIPKMVMLAKELLIDIVSMTIMIPANTG